MSRGIAEIENQGDAERISALILRSLYDDDVSFNPYQDRIFQFGDGSIQFMGKELKPEEALEQITNRVWRDRKKINKLIKKWEKVGSNFVNCGC
ncbi:MAG: hypothetical protein ISS63_01865 [Desulfobacteraceae bacterium]|nr:hypothetical protein [Desulfobacteraceae bacterium]